MGINFDKEIRALLILCSLPESGNDLVMAMSNSVCGSNTLKFGKTLVGSTSRSSLNTQSRCIMTKRGSNSRNHGKST